MTASTVAQYLAALPADRRAALSAVRKVINENLPKGYEEGMQFGMIGLGRMGANMVERLMRRNFEAGSLCSSAVIVSRCRCASLPV